MPCHCRDRGDFLVELPRNLPGLLLVSQDFTALRQASTGPAMTPKKSPRSFRTLPGFSQAENLHLSSVQPTDIFHVGSRAESLISSTAPPEHAVPSRPLTDGRFLVTQSPAYFNHFNHFNHIRLDHGERRKAKLRGKRHESSRLKGLKQDLTRPGDGLSDRFDWSVSRVMEHSRT